MRLFRPLPLLLYTVFSAWPQTPPPSDLEAVVATDLGSFRLAFAPDKAPRHVEQFIRLARQGYYDGSAFHMMVANGVIQGGDPLLKNPKTPKNPLASELSDLKHERGVVSSVGDQFFVCLSPQRALDGQYSTFGRVVEGIDTVERISQTTPPVRIDKVTIFIKE